MAEESDLEKTEPASARRIEKAREDGKVARSRELSTLLMLATAISGLWFTAMSLGEMMIGWLRRAMQFDRSLAFESGRMLFETGQMAVRALLALAPLFTMMMLAALVAPMLLGGWLLSAEAVAPNFGKLDPRAGIARMFSTQSLAELFKALAKSVLIGGVAYLVIFGNLEAMVELMSQPARSALPQSLELVGRNCGLIAAVLLVVALVDVPWQIWSHHKKLRMSREDVRKEHKESEGDPHVKARIRRLQQALARRRMMAEVPHADIVITNPTHFAVALKYLDSDMRAPRVVAKGSDLIAQRIREVAVANHVVILEAPPLTRAIYKHTQLGGEIPSGLYTVVAEVLAWVYRIKRWEREGGEAPPKPRDLRVPEALADELKAA